MSVKIVIAAGGTGGHIFPGLTFAKHFITKGHTVEWIGTKKGLESKLIPQNNININYINISGLRGKNWLTKFLAPYNIIIAILQSLILLVKLKPNVVLGMGGFVAGPVGIAAWLLRIKLIIHEQNAIAGTSNRILGLFANHILASFEDSFPKNLKYNTKTLVVGNPVRENLAAVATLPLDLSKQHDGFNILVLGGSRGARFLNQIIPEALADLENIRILHQTGEQDLDYTTELYAKKNLQHAHIIKAFIDDMLTAYLNADLIICRSGASTVFEIMAIGAASIMIPLPWAIDDHQTKNAQFLANQGGCVLIAQNNLDPEKLKSLVLDLKNNIIKLNALRQNARLQYNKYQASNNMQRALDLILG